MRWRRITAIANGILRPAMITLEDYRDACDLLEATGRTVPRNRWAEECIAAVQHKQNESIF